VIETIALRFRDLAGPTIVEHSEMISQHGSVWWGWWSKPGEKLPRELFAQFLDQIEADGEVTWFLADSGERKVYRATVTGICFSGATQRIPSPEPERTPPYYAEQEWLAWFRFSSIEEADESDLTAKSYSEPPLGTFDDDPHREAFDGKRVFSLDEMLSRHRTIYFLRDGQDDDLEHLAALVPSLPIAPFMPEALEVPSSYIVQISDLHFGPNHAFPDVSNEIQRNLALRVSDDLNQKYGGEPPAAVILSGDFTWQGTPEEFAKALDFIDHLQSVFEIHRSRFIVCPGNHDIQWSPPAEDYDPDKPVTVATPDAQANYRSFVSDAIKLSLPSDSMAIGRRFLLSNFVPVDIISLDSSRLEQESFAGYGFVSRQQIDDAAEKLGWGASEKGGQYRVLVLHHHVVPVLPVEAIGQTDARYSLTLDAGELLYRALELNVDLILHGHMHRSFTALHGRLGPDISFPASRRLVIQAAGSAGVKAQHLAPGTVNSYQIYEFTPEGVKVRRRDRSTDTEGFTDGGSYNLARIKGQLQ
jgi:3',5'-cyclic AMP phosphodiesterase CpdA